MEVETNHEGRLLLLKYLNVLTMKNLPANELEYKQKDISIDEVGYLIDNLEVFISTTSNSFSRSQAIVKLTELIVNFGLVPKADTDDQDFGAACFPHVAEYAEKCFEYLKILIQEINNLELKHKREFLINTILLYATHNTTYAWTSDASIQISTEFSKDLLDCTQHENFSRLLTDNQYQPSIFKGTLKKLRPCLLKDTWMLFPSSAPLFSWYLHNVKHPYLVDYLSDVLPPAFMFSSYHKPSEKTIGIRCFDHILDNVPPSMIKLDNTEDAIYHTLFPYIYSKESEVVSSLFPCLLKLPMMQPPKDRMPFWGKFDDVFSQLLFAVATESNMALKDLFLNNILGFCKHTAPFKHLKCIMDIVVLNLKVETPSDSICRVGALKILKSVITSCWPRMPSYCFKILLVILELHEDKENITKYDKSAQNAISQLCEECIILLKHACGEKFEATTASFIEDCGHMSECKYLKSVLAKLADDA